MPSPHDLIAAPQDYKKWLADEAKAAAEAAKEAAKTAAKVEAM